MYQALLTILIYFVYSNQFKEIYTFPFVLGLFFRNVDDIYVESPVKTPKKDKKNIRTTLVDKVSSNCILRLMSQITFVICFSAKLYDYIGNVLCILFSSILFDSIFFFIFRYNTCNSFCYCIY